MNKIYYLDDDNNLTNKENSTHSMIQEFDDNGRLIKEIFTIKSDNTKNEKYIPSQETQNILDDILVKAGYKGFSK